MDALHAAFCGPGALALDIGAHVGDRTASFRRLGARIVAAVTLDELIARHGLPDFVKIDVEGFEAAVLAGLSRPLPALSVEFTTLARGPARAALRRLRKLGEYRFNVSIGEAHRLEFVEWRGPREIDSWLREIPESVNSGDIYARRNQPRRAPGLLRKNYGKPTGFRQPDSAAARGSS